jgi:hypothetical protein
MTCLLEIAGASDLYAMVRSLRRDRDDDPEFYAIRFSDLNEVAGDI